MWTELLFSGCFPYCSALVAGRRFIRGFPFVVLSSQFLRSIKSRFGAKERQRQDQLEEELLRVKVFGNGRRVPFF